MIALHFFLYLTSIIQNPHIHENSYEFLLKNNHMQVGISKTDGLITSITLGTKDIFDGTSSFDFNKQTTAIHQTVLSTGRPILDDGLATIEFVIEYDKEIVTHRYVIDTIALQWEIDIKYDPKNNQEKYIVFSLPIAKNLEEIFHYGHYEPFKSKEIDEIELTYRQDLFIPMITGYSPSRSYGLSIVAPFNHAKPKLQFVINNKDYIASFHHLQPDPNTTVNASIYIVPHEGDWRPCLDFVLKKYPEYFSPLNDSEISAGWYYLAFPDVREEQISALHDRNVEWIEFHEYFPFYGLYMPHLPDWGIILDSDEVGLTQWETGAGIKRNSYQNMKDLIRLWHKYGIQVFLYYQSSEAWYQYAQKYFNEDIAIDRKGNPHPSWQSTRLMNPDPNGDWGRYIIDQAKKILKTFPEIDGIFYDRIDYNNYDFGHDDGFTMIDGQPAYMLAFGQERINRVLFDLFHKSKKAIWGNVPTSIEVCKGLDGIMAEKNLRHLLKLQYLGLARPIIYRAFDGLPTDTERKMKNALVYGATISVTHGGKEAQNIESKYRTIFELLKNRTWVLNAFCLEIPEGLQGNIYRTHDSDYVVVIVSPDKLQVKNHPFEYNIPITVNTPDAEQIKHAYLLSGDWQGINDIETQREGNVLKITLPYHIATSVIYLTKKKKYELVRISPPILIKGYSNKIMLRINDNIRQHDIELHTPWVRERKQITTDIIEFDIAVPENAAGEIDIVIFVDGKEFLFSSWVVEPVSLAPQENIFIHHREGEDVPFYLSNNLRRPITLNMYGSFAKGTGSIETPDALTLAPFETKSIEIRIVSESTGNAALTARFDNKKIVFPLIVKTGLVFGNDDLFHDDFSKGMNKWTVLAGMWNTAVEMAQCSGPAHLACVYNHDWHNYIFESTIRCRGSSNPHIDWLKSYIFFRVQDDKNYYRFGIQGDSGVLSLYKRIDGKWKKLRTVPFTPIKGKWYTLRAQIEGTKISCFVDGEKYMTVYDRTFQAGGIGIGVLEDALECDYKNVVVKRL